MDEEIYDMTKGEYTEYINIKEEKKIKEAKIFSEKYNNKNIIKNIFDWFSVIMKITIVAFIGICFNFGFLVYLDVMGSPINMNMIMFSVGVTCIMVMYIFMCVADLVEKKE